MNGTPQMGFTWAPARPVRGSKVKVWGSICDEVLRVLASSGLRFTADDVIDRCGLPEKAGAKSNNAVGARILAASKSGLIVSDGYAKSRRPERKRSVVMVWRGRGDVGKEVA